ncbi:unnamed protein product [Prunus brigantina]
MDNLKREDADAWGWLIERPAKNWSRSHFATHYKCDLVLNNLCESFNAAIIDARDKPILTCLERIRIYIMIRMANRRASCQHWRYTVGPRIFNIIEKNKLASSQCIPRLAGEKKYQVSQLYWGEFAVNLRANTCSCRRWDLCGIPCPHAISAIFHRNEDIKDYVDKLYKKDAYLKTYRPIIGPVPSIDQWPRSGLPAIKPPNFRIQPGRPRKVRTKEPGEVEIPAPVPPHPKPPNWKPQPARLRRIFIKIRCTRCGQQGHNKRGCERVQQMQAEEGQAPAPQAQAPTPQAQTHTPQAQAPAPQAQNHAPQAQAPAPQAQDPAPQAQAQSQAQAQAQTEAFLQISKQGQWQQPRVVEVEGE